MYFNVNHVVNQLAAANHTNGLLQAEKEVLEAECEKQALEIKCLREELSALKEELEREKSMWRWTYNEKERYKAQYEELTKDVTPEEILKDLPEELK